MKNIGTGKYVVATVHEGKGYYYCGSQTMSSQFDAAKVTNGQNVQAVLNDAQNFAPFQWKVYELELKKAPLAK